MEHPRLKSTTTYLERLAGRLILIFAVPVASLWMILAVWFSNLPGRIIPVVVTVALGVAILAILALVKGRWRAIGLVFCLFAAIYIWHHFIPPSNSRDWQPSVARLSTATFSKADDSVTVHNIRNFEYRSPHDFDASYYDQTFSLGQLHGVDLIISYWGHDAMAHTFLSFEFADESHLAISIEVRPEIDEVYHPLAGLFKQYEIIYVIGDERDLIRLRSNYRGEETYLYQSTATPDQARRLFVEILTRVNQLAQKPAYYGTIQKNCTTALVKHVNKILVNDIPFSGRLLFNGFSDRLAYMNGNIRRVLPFPDLKAACYISGIAQSLGNDPEFSTKIRTHIQEDIETRKK
jgi:hypothetical protein